MNPADYDASPSIQIDPSSFVPLREALHPDRAGEVVDLRFRDHSIDEVADLIEPGDDFDELFFASRFVDEIDRLTRRTEILREPAPPRRSDPATTPPMSIRLLQQPPPYRQSKTYRCRQYWP